MAHLEWDFGRGPFLDEHFAVSEKTASTFQLVAFDADDTLWVNEPFYQDAQRKLQDILSRHAGNDHLGDRLCARERHNLSIFGYGAKGFTLSMIETAIELSQGEISSKEIQAIIDIGKSLIRRPIELLPRVRETIEKLSVKFDLMIITKGDLFDQESKIARSGLAELFSNVEIVSEKDEKTYSELLDRQGVRPEHFLMIGNSLRSDILPVISIGASAVHIPCDTTWQHEKVAIEESQRAGFHELAGIEEIPALIRRLDSRQLGSTFTTG